MISVADAIARVGLTRLAHFTPSKNLPHILGDGLIRSSKDLAENAPDYFDPTDRERFDNHPDRLCCSLEYPNGYYLAVAQNKPQFTNYPHWVCLLLDARLLTRPGTLFSPCNAARAGGAYLAEGGDALFGCYADPSVPGGWPRGPQHRRGAPTDLQAEALVPGPIDLSHLHAIVVPSEGDAKNESGRLEKLRIEAASLTWVVAPMFFERDVLSARLRWGGDIPETKWARSER
jgi:ssDNA thymidine ADP-ribosyltransferase DarT-like protein